MKNHQQQQQEHQQLSGTVMIDVLSPYRIECDQGRSPIPFSATKTTQHPSKETFLRPAQLTTPTIRNDTAPNYQNFVQQSDTKQQRCTANTWVLRSQGCDSNVVLVEWSRCSGDERRIPPLGPIALEPVALTASSLSLSRCVKAIMMSLCFISSCLYLSTCQ